ncbi:LPXTG cell wall anchor domain-containing protein [Clostridium sp. YIM B02505]|uniref:LPXTG cell wall anchor domain-containing protein n=1 Tax=Clostridium yunnanense TaxID=2800325 RepID=A0ABS1EUJ2_9CLOT|nr:immunoglobulin-like domain-containing protein [Clostridium yunnanense]MBK1813045.1 LPXTG cell wall anchor domain-containing protein [Clostridium yunnanense]
MRSKKAKRFVTFLVVLAMLFVDVVQITGINKSLIAKADETDTSAYGEVLVSDVGTNPTLQNGNTSRKLAVASDGTIYAVYRSNEGIRVAKSTDNGASFKPSVNVYNMNNEAEVAVSSSGIVYVTWIESGMIKVSRSTDHAATFSEPINVGASNDMSVHMTTDGNYLYFIDRSGRNFYKSEDGGDTFSHYDFAENYVFSDVHVDPFTHNVIVQKDNPSITYYISTDHGQTFSEPHMPGNQVFFSVGSIAATADTSYLLIAGQNNLGVKVNLTTGVSTTPDMGNNQVSQGRSLSDDWYGNVVTGFSDGSYVYFSVSGDLGETFGTPVQVAQTQVANASINSTNGDILFLYEKEGNIYLKVFGGKLQGYDLNVSNSSLFFDASASSAAKKITVTNISEDPISIVDIKTTGEFTLDRTGIGSTLNPGQSGEISITYNPSENPTSAGKVSILYGSPTKERIISLNGALDGGGVVVGPTDPSGPVSEPAADLAATASKGTVVGDTKIAATTAGGNHLAVKVSDKTVSTPNKGDAAPTGVGVTNPYNAGNDLNLGDYNVNRYVAVYELDDSDKVVGFKLINLQDNQIYGIPSTVDATASKGTNSQETKVNATAGNGNHIAVKVSNELIETPVEGQDAPLGGGVYNPYVNGTDINLGDYTVNRYLGVYELDDNNKVVGFKVIKLSSVEVNTTAKVINASAEKGSNTGETKINVTPGFGNHIAVKVTSEVLSTPNIGDPAPVGEGVTNAYVPGSNLELGNYTQNKYVGVYELDGDNNVVGFKFLELTAEQINRTAPAIMVDPEKGSATGQSKLIVSPENGNYIAVKVSDQAVTTPNIGDDAPTGVGVTNPYNSNTDINLGDFTKNKYLAVYELDTNNKVVGFKLVNLADEDINREAPVIVATTEKGTENGNTKVNAIPGVGNHLAIKVSNAPLGTPNVGDSMELGLGITNPYTPGSDINLGDYVNNKYLGVYELDLNNKIVGFKLITLTNEDVNRVSPEIVVTPEKGTTLGKTQLSGTPGIGNHLAVMVAEMAVPTPNKGDDMPLGLGITNPYTPGTDINLGDYNKNKYLAVYELDSDNKVVGFKLVALIDEDINRTAPEVVVAPQKGTNTGDTKINAAVGNGNHLAIKVSDKDLSSVNVNVGDAAPVGEGVINPYTANTDINLGDYTKNKYLGIYELDSNDKVVGFRALTLIDLAINRTAPEVTAEPGKGTSTGETKITATAGNGNHLVVKVSDSEIPAVNIGDAAPTGEGVTNPYTSGTDINLGDYKTNKYVVVYEVDSDGKVVSFKSITLTNEDINRTAPEVTVEPQKGTTLGKTQVDATVDKGNQLVVKVSDTEIPSVNIGDAAPTGEGVTNPYVPGTDIDLGDYTKNKYLGVYEIDKDGNIVGFKSVTLTNEEINRTAPEVTVDPEKGTTGGKTQVNVTSAPGNHIVVKVSDTVLPSVNVGDAAPTGEGVTNPYVSGTDINLGDYAKNKYLGVYEVDSNGKIVGFKSVTLTNEEINTTAPEVVVAPQKGTNTGDTKINAEVGNGNHLAIKVSDKDLSSANVNVGDAAPAGEGVINPYTANTDINLGDYTKNKYLGIYELDANNKVVGFRALTLIDLAINRTAPQIEADAEEGANKGTTKVTATADNGNHIVVKVSDSVNTAVNVGDAEPTGTGVINPYVSGSDINLGDYTKNKYLEVYEVDSNGKVVGFKSITLTNEDINRTSEDVVAYPEKGSTLGKTKVNATAGVGNHLAVMVSDVLVQIPNSGDSMPVALGVVNPYVSGTDINLGDYTKNKYLAVYELDSNNKVVGFRLLALNDEVINETAPEVNVTADKGTDLGKTKVTATAGNGNHLVVKVSNTEIPSVNVGEAAPTGAGVTNPYVSGTDINLGDYAKNKYLGVYEVDSNGKVVGFKSVTLTNEDINTTAPEVNVTTDKGAALGETKVTATVGNGNHLAVKVSDVLPEINANVGDEVQTGAGLVNPYVSGTNIDLGDYAKNKYLTVYELDGNNKVVGYKVITLTNEEINTTAPEVVVAPQKGTNNGETKISAEVAPGNHLVVKVSDTVLPSVNVGDVAPTGEGVTNPYVSGTDINLGDYTKNKYLGVYEVDANGKVVGFKPVTLTNEIVNTTAPEVNAEPAVGSKVGTTKVTASVENGNHLVVKVSDSQATVVNKGDAVPTGTGVTNPYVSGTDISLGDYTKNKYLEVYEVDSNNKVVGFKAITLTNEDINRTSEDVVAYPEKGTTLGKTKVNATAGLGNHLAVMVSDVLVQIPSRGDGMPVSLAITNPYVSGTDINLGDYTKNKYLAVYELDSNNKVVGFRLITLANEDINRTAPVVTVTPDKGTDLGKTKVAATVTDGNHLVVKVSDTVLPSVNVGDAAPTGTGVTSNYVSGTDINLGDYTKNKYLGVYEVDTNGKVVGFKSVTLTNDQINRTAPQVTVTPDKGTSTGKTKVTATVGYGNHLAVKVSDTLPQTSANVGDVVSTGTGLTNPYVSGSDISLGDYSKNKYLTVYELDANNKVVGYKVITLTSEAINTTAPQVTTTSTVGSAPGTTKINATAGYGNKLAVKVLDGVVAAPNVGDAAPTGTGVTNPYVSGTDIALGDYTKNKYVAVYELDSNNKVVGFKVVTLADSVINKTIVLNDTQSVTSDKESLQVKYADGDSANSVTKPITLAGSGSNGTSITWNSNPSGLVSKDGTLSRPLFDTDVKLTATIAKGKISDTKEFALKLKGTVPVLYDLNSGSELIEPTDKEKETVTKQNEVNIGGNREYLVDLFIMSIEKKNTNYEGKAVKIEIEEKPVVDTRFFNAIDGKDINLTFTGNKVGWTFNGKDITADKFAGMDKIDLSLKEPSAELITSIGKKLKTDSGKVVEYATFSYTYDGFLPGKATAKVYVGKQWANKTVDVGRFYMDKDNYDIVAKTVKVDSEGYVAYVTDHCSDYFVVETNTLTPTTTTPTDDLPKTGSPINANALALAGLMLAALGFVALRRNRKAN